MKKNHRQAIGDLCKESLFAFWLSFFEGTTAGNSSNPFFISNGENEKLYLNVYDTILLLQQRQNWLGDYLRDNEFGALPFVGRFSGVNDFAAIVQNIRNVLELPENWASQFSTWTDALKHLVATIEDKGIVVTTAILNLHKCSRLYMNLHTSGRVTAQVLISESYCRQTIPSRNSVIALQLNSPEKAFDRVWQQTPNTHSIARYFKVSEIVAARRALDTGKWTKDHFFEFYQAYSRREFQKKRTHIFWW